MISTHHELIAHLQESGILRNSRIIEAFEAIDRRDFVPGEYKNVAYEDHPLSIGHGQTISQPYTVAFMIELLDPKKDQSILDIGSGSGWTTALLGKIVERSGKVLGLERIPELITFGQKNLAKYTLPQASIEQAGETFGCPGKQFDRILVSAAAIELPSGLMNQLKEDGILIIPIGNSIWRFTKHHDSYESEEFPGFIFVPLIT